MLLLHMRKIIIIITIEGATNSTPPVNTALESELLPRVQQVDGNLI